MEIAMPSLISSDHAGRPSQAHLVVLIVLTLVGSLHSCLAPEAAFSKWPELACPHKCRLISFVEICFDAVQEGRLCATVSFRAVW